MFFIHIINLLIRFNLILTSEIYFNNESVLIIPISFGKWEDYYSYPHVRELNTEMGKFNFTFKRCPEDGYICHDYMIFNISNKITNESFEGIDPQAIKEREKPNELIILREIIPFLKFLKNLGYIKKTILGTEYNRYFGGLPESLKKKYNYTTSFKIKQIYYLNSKNSDIEIGGNFKYIMDEKIINMRFNFDNSTSIYSNEEIELSMCPTLYFFLYGHRPKYLKSLVKESHKKHILDFDLFYTLIKEEFFPNFTIIFDGKEITFPKSTLLDFINEKRYYLNCTLGLFFFKLFDAYEIDIDNNIITLYSNEEIFKHFDNGNNKKKIKYNIFINFTIVFIIFVVLILFFRNKIRKENQENYEKYFNMEKLLKK